ncbi:hypothetical protein PM8797T_17012 [Gimesia maris DSM 8797]|nr:hypothetical protein PM8797T_17012 [Gimesia maris DSM 8797]
MGRKQEQTLSGVLKREAISKRVFGISEIFVDRICKKRLPPQQIRGVLLRETPARQFRTP